MLAKRRYGHEPVFVNHAVTVGAKNRKVIHPCFRFTIDLRKHLAVVNLAKSIPKWPISFGEIKSADFTGQTTCLDERGFALLIGNALVAFDYVVNKELPPAFGDH